MLNLLPLLGGLLKMFLLGPNHLLTSKKTWYAISSSPVPKWKCVLFACFLPGAGVHMLTISSSNAHRELRAGLTTNLDVSSSRAVNSVSFASSMIPAFRAQLWCTVQRPNFLSCLIHSMSQASCWNHQSLSSSSWQWGQHPTLLLVCSDSVTASNALHHDWPIAYAQKVSVKI